MPIVFLVVIATLICVTVSLWVVASVCRERQGRFAETNLEQYRRYTWKFRRNLALGTGFTVATVVFTMIVAPTLQHYHP